MEVYPMSDFDEVKLDLLLEQLLTSGRAEVRANGSSMKPFIHQGDLLTLQRKNEEPYVEGEIVAFVKDSLIFIHRLIRAEDRSGLVLTKGDHLEISDAMIRRDALIARVVQVNGKPMADTRLQQFFFNLYRFSMSVGKNSIHGQNQLVTRIDLTPFRFTLTKGILKLSCWMTRAR